MLNKHWITLPVVYIYSRRFAPKAVFFSSFEGFRVRRLLFLIIEGKIIGELKSLKIAQKIAFEAKGRQSVVHKDCMGSLCKNSPSLKMMGFDHSIIFRFFKRQRCKNCQQWCSNYRCGRKQTGLSGRWALGGSVWNVLRRIFGFKKCLTSNAEVLRNVTCCATDRSLRKLCTADIGSSSGTRETILAESCLFVRKHHLSVVGYLLVKRNNHSFVLVCWSKVIY